ncbi:MAG: DsrE family protein, partial [Gammaproteobacteria bacterium]|nr:DsrE family protein [Gammaproteobacteria bacterium]
TKAAIASSEAYDPGSSELLECIRVRDDFKVVMAWNNKSINGKILATKGENVGQQVVNARNLVRDYENNYGMMHMSEYEMVVVAYAGGVDWLRTSNDQEDINMVNGLLNKGVKIYACQNTMKSKGIVIGDLIPGVRIVPAGVSAVIDFANRRYNYLNP